MAVDSPGSDARKWLSEILGYLNFSSGTQDAGFLRGLNRLFGQLASSSAGGLESTWEQLGKYLQRGIETVRGQSDAFRDTAQVEAVVPLVFEHVLPEYRLFHRDLLHHQSPESLFQPFFIGRVCEAVLAEGAPWEERDRVVQGAIARLNDHIGHRPVAVLRTAQKIQPYPHEWVRPIPLYVAGVGASVGPYQEVVEKALEILRQTPKDLLDQAWFSPERIEELAVDPRAYDFDHPVNRRPNYHFGGWDPHRIDNHGYYRRYVIQQVTLDALWRRVQERKDLPREEVLFEAAAVMAGTILMGSGITGHGPDIHDSSVTLSNLLPHIAAYRDAFYIGLLERRGGPHGERLRAEAHALRQPFGGARQHLNQTLARRRAEQLQHVSLARLYARMGYTQAATEQTQVVQVASARMRCEIDCRLTTSHLAIDRGELAPAAALLPEMEDLLHRAIQCGAMVDPWNILGFGGQFSKFPAVEDSIHDHRVDELLELMNDLFALDARLIEESAAAGENGLRGQVSKRFEKLARWWDQFASTEVSEVEGVSGRQAWESAEQVGEALAAWRDAGTAAGNVAFWRTHAEQFRSPKAFALLVEALLNQRDLVAAMALLMHWLSRSEEIPLAQGPYSFHALALRWMRDVWGLRDRPEPSSAVDPSQRCPLSRKFLDYLEANAEHCWSVPKLELAGQSLDGGIPEQAPSGGEDDLFGAAYEEVTYRDTTDDGFDGEMLEGNIQATDFELSAEANRIQERLTFLITVSRLWKLTAGASASQGSPQRDEALAGWVRQVSVWRQQFAELLSAVSRYRIPAPRGTHESLVEFDRRRAIKEALLERIIAASIETADAGIILAALNDKDQEGSDKEEWEGPVRAVLHGLVQGKPQAVRQAWPVLPAVLSRRPLLYLPTVRGGNPERIAASRTMQQMLRRLLVYLPRLGLLTEAFQLLGTIQEMERNHPVGAGAVTEFDRLFEIGCRAILECIVHSSDDWKPKKAGPDKAASNDRLLIDSLEQAGERLLRRWLSHSRNVRISVLETVSEKPRWQGMKQFIQRYGRDLFTQKFMTFSNLRAILHQGVDEWLRSVEEDGDPGERFQLLEELDHQIPRQQAVQWLELILEAVVENYSEYVDYNSTTTQSDRGEMLYTLLDFLRLEASYDRVAWNLRPVILAHEVLVRSGRMGAADLWRRMVAQRSATMADEHLERLEKLVTKYGMKLPSVADRLRERFVRPLAVDRLCALVGPAIDELRSAAPLQAFEQLQAEIAPFLKEPSGVGFDIPGWLEALGIEVHRRRAGHDEDDDLSQPYPRIPQTRLTRAEVERQLADWDQ